MIALELVLLDRAREHVDVFDLGTFACPDCDGDPDCSTCGEPTRVYVMGWLQRALKRWLS